MTSLRDPDRFEDYDPFSEKKKPGLVSRCASEIEIESVEWLWPGRIARGKHTSFAGDPGGGKSTLSMCIAATISMRGDWPCGEGSSPQGSVLILIAEDGAGDTIAPRLHAAEADLGRVHIVSAVKTGDKCRGFDLQADIELLERKIAEIGDVALVIIDPISSYLGKTDSHKNSEVRGVLEPLSTMAERTRVAVLSITHFSKAGAATNSKALHRFIGSIAFVGAPRMAFAVIEDAEDKGRRLMLHAKNNLAPPPQGLAFRLKQTIVGAEGHGIVASRVDWDAEPVTITANEALAADEDGSHAGQREEAENFLRKLLADGPVSAKQVKADADSAGLTWATVRRAKDRLGIKPQKAGMDTGWLWALPKVLNHPEDAQSKYVSTFGESELLRENPKRLTTPVGKPEDAQSLDVGTFATSEHLRDVGQPPEQVSRPHDGDPFEKFKDPRRRLQPAERKPWAKPQILSDEPRDPRAWPLEPDGLGAA